MSVTLGYLIFPLVAAVVYAKKQVFKRNYAIIIGWGERHTFGFNLHSSVSFVRAFKYRDRVSIMGDILKTVKTARNGGSKYQIMQNARLNYIQAKKYLCYMQNAGFLNSCNALTTTSLQLQIPTLLLIYYAGDFGDRGFTTLGSVTEPALQALGIRYTVLRRADEIDEMMCGAQILAEDSKKPVAVLLTKNVLGVK